MRLRNCSQARSVWLGRRGTIKPCRPTRWAVNASRAECLPARLAFAALIRNQLLTCAFTCVDYAGAIRCTRLPLPSRFRGKAGGHPEIERLHAVCVAGRDRGDGRVDEPPAFFGRGWPGPKARSRSETRNDSLN